jgi:glucuronokinase
MSGDVVIRVPARVGLVGNPSDGYGGAVLAAPVDRLVATVTGAASPEVRLVADVGVLAWPTLDAWRSHVAAEGHGDEQRIVSAALWTLVEHLRSRSGVVDGVTLTWRTEVPRSVGLAGSSAIAVAVIEAAAAVWDVSLDPRAVAALALRAEREVLGIAAGWQDRIVQAHRCTVLVDAADLEMVDGCEVPRVRRLAESSSGRAEVSLVVGWSTGTSESSDSYHAPLRRSAEALATPMARLADLARRAADAWAGGAYDEVAAAMSEGWRTRQACAPLRPDHTAVVEDVRAAGVAATTPGSGGSVVALCLDREQEVRVNEALATAGLSSIVHRLA